MILNISDAAGSWRHLQFLVVLAAGLVMVGCGLWACERPSATPGGADNAPTTPPPSPTDTSSEADSSMNKNPSAGQPSSQSPARIVKSDVEWKAQLTPEQYHVLREKGTERAFTGKYWNTTTQGVYRCAACGEILFTSDDKFASECGWPSFSEKTGKIDEHVDTSFGMVRTEVTCAKCGGHLGHVFDDGPGPKGLRYCINSASIDLEPAKTEDAKAGKGSEQNPSPAAKPEDSAPRK